MTVVYNAEKRLFPASDVLWSKPELINAMVRDVLIGQTEAFIDMTIDCERPEDITRASMNETLRGVKDSARDYLEDVVADFRRAVFEALDKANYGAVVTGIKYDLAGDVKDIEVDVSVS